MPNIFKHFLRPQVEAFQFPQVDDLVVEPEPPPPEPVPDPEEVQPAADDASSEVVDEEPGPDPGQGAAAMFSYARVQAEAIVAQAKQEGEQLLAQYRQQAEEEARQMQEEARQEGYRQGYAEGMAKAQEEGRAKLEEQCHQQAEELKKFLDEAVRAKDDLLSRAQDELCELSIAVAEKVIHVSLKSSREIILRMVQMAAERLRRREWVRIYIGGYDSRELAQIAPELTASLAGLSDHIKLIPMANDESGTCIIEMPDEIIDASASTQLDNLKDILRGG